MNKDIRAAMLGDHETAKRPIILDVCGAPMTDEAVDMMLERWKEALDNA